MLELSWKERGRLWLRLFVRFALAAIFLLLVAKIGMPVLSFCMPFVLGFIFAWLLEPVLRIIIKRTILSRKSVSIILILLICGILGGATTWLVYKVFIEVAALSANWAFIWEEASNAFTQLSDYVNRLFTYLPPEGQEIASSMTTQLLDWFKDLGTTSLIPKTTSFAIKIPSVVLSLIFFLMSLYFIMADYPRIGAVVTDWMPLNLRRFLRFLEKTFQAAFTGYIRAELLLSLAVFFILVIGFSIMDLPYALLLALGLAVLDFIPIIGAGTVMVPWAIIDMIIGDWKTAVTLLIIWSVIVLFRRLAEPRFLGSQTGLHPVLSLLSIFVGMKAFGVLGMILAPTLLLVVINVARSGVFHAVVSDISLAFQDLSALLKHREDKPKS